MNFQSPILLQPFFSSQIDTFNKNAARFYEIYKLLEIENVYASNKWKENVQNIKNYLLPKPRIDFLNNKIIQNTMFVTAKGVWLSEQINFLNKRYSYYNLFKLVREDFIGLPILHDLIHFTSHNSIHHLYHLTYFQSQTKETWNNLATVVEWGGGYGNLAKIFYRINPNATYILIDLPIFSSLQWLYLTSVCNDVPVHLITDAKDSIKKKSINIVPSHLAFEILYPKQIDLFIATWSLSECPRAIQENVYRHNFFNAKHLLLGYQRNNNDFKHAESLGLIAKRKGARNMKIPFIPGNFYSFL